LIGNGRGGQTVVEQKGYRKTWSKYGTQAAFEVSEEKVVRHQIKRFSPNTVKPVEESSNFHYFTFMNAVQQLAIL